jgi:hypothetical protein
MIRRPPRPRASSAALRQRLRLVVAGDVRPAIEDPGAALGDGAVKCDEFRVEVAARLVSGYRPIPGIQGASVLAVREPVCPRSPEDERDPIRDAPGAW